MGPAVASHRRSASIGCEDAAGLAVKPPLVGDIHLDVLADDDVEARVGKRQGECVRLVDVDQVVEPDRGVQPARDVAILARKVDACHVAVDLTGKEACGAADAAAGVEEPGPLL